MALPLYKAIKILKAGGGFNANLTAEAEAVVKAAEEAEAVVEAPAPPEPPAEVDEDVQLPDVP